MVAADVDEGLIAHTGRHGKSGAPFCCLLSWPDIEGSCRSGFTVCAGHSGALFTPVLRLPRLPSRACRHAAAQGVVCSIL